MKYELSSEHNKDMIFIQFYDLYSEMQSLLHGNMLQRWNSNILGELQEKKYLSKFVHIEVLGVREYEKVSMIHG